MGLHQAIYEKTGYEMKYIRPPKGEYSERSLDATNKLGYTTVMWTFGYMDYDENKQKGTEYAKKIILDNLHNGEIMLLHGNSKDNANVLDEIIKRAKAEGYEFKSLDEFERQVVKIKKRRNKLERILEMPIEVTTSNPKITILGFSELLIENFKGIIEYEDYLIKINTFIGIVIIEGDKLNLNQITENDVSVNGEIEKIYFEPAEED